MFSLLAMCVFVLGTSYFYQLLLVFLEDMGINRSFCGGEGGRKG